MGRLCITRKPGESVVIRTTEGDVTVSLVRLDNGRAVLAFVAPDFIPINRQEIAKIREKRVDGTAEPG